MFKIFSFVDIFFKDLFEIDPVVLSSLILSTNHESMISSWIRNKLKKTASFLQFWSKDLHGRLKVVVL